MKYSGFWRRFAAKLIDTLIFFPLLIINIKFIKPIGKDAFYGVGIAISIITILYNVLFLYFIEKTPGKAVMKIKVTKTDGNRIRLGNSILRELFAIVSVIITFAQDYKIFGNASFINMIGFGVSTIYGLECLMYFFNAKCKTLHDYIADTVVIEEAKKN